MPTTAPPQGSYSSRIEARLKRQKLRALDAYDAIVIALANGENVSDEELQSALTAAEIPPESLQADLYRAERRRAAQVDLSKQPAAEVEVAKFDAEEQAEHDRHARVMSDIRERRAPHDAANAAGERARELLVNTKPRRLKRAKVVVMRAISAQQRVIDSRVHLTPDEDDVITIGGYIGQPYDERNYVGRPGSDSAAIRSAQAAVEQRRAALEVDKDLARKRIGELELALRRLDSVSLVAVPSLVAIDCVLTDAGLPTLAAADGVDEDAADDRQHESID